MTKTFDAGQDLIGRLGPPERLRAFIRDVDVATNGLSLAKTRSGSQVVDLSARAGHNLVS
jgi:hypothetical protein